MNHPTRILLATLLAALLQPSMAQETRDDELLKITALEALMSAPPERALPLVRRVLAGNGSTELKERALFVASQLDTSEAHALVLDVARDTASPLAEDAIRMIGIGGNPASLNELRGLYAAGDEDTKDAVLEAYMIADDSAAVLSIAENAKTADEFGAAVEMLGAMGALEELRSLRGRPDSSEELIEAFAIAGDVETLLAMANDGGDTERQQLAIEGLAIAGDENVGPLLVNIYRETSNDDVREAALEGMLITDYDTGVLELFRASDDPHEKRALLEMLVAMDSDAVWDIVDSTLGEER